MIVINVMRQQMCEGSTISVILDTGKSEDSGEEVGQKTHSRKK